MGFAYVVIYTKQCDSKYYAVMLDISGTTLITSISREALSTLEMA